MSVALVSGANSPLGADRVVVEIRCAATLDVSALKLGADGKVRDDSDFVFYNQPVAAGVEHREEGAGSPDAVVIDTSALDVEHVAVVASLDGEGAFGAAGPVEVAVRDAGSGSPLVTFTPAGLTDETAIIAVEVYARGGVWKVRAVGQGYDAGLAGVAADFGVEVADTPHDAPDADSEPAAAPPPPSPPSRPAAIAEPTAAPPAPPVPEPAPVPVPATPPVAPPEPVVAASSQPVAPATPPQPPSPKGGPAPGEEIPHPEPAPTLPPPPVTVPASVPVGTQYPAPWAPAYPPGQAPPVSEAEPTLDGPALPDTDYNEYPPR